MSAAPAADVSTLDESHTEWRILIERPCNVLIDGTVSATDAVLRRLQAHIAAPIVRHRPPAALELPNRETRTLILTDAAALSKDEQRRLLAWMRDTGSRTQIITTASCPLFALVEDGRFEAPLYYRLNVLLLRVTSSLQHGLPGSGADGTARLTTRS
jgi:sigma-54-interacting transcriptional regulator